VSVTIDAAVVVMTVAVVAIVEVATVVTTDHVAIIMMLGSNFS
jgi:hypothetical protein